MPPAALISTPHHRAVPRGTEPSLNDASLAAARHWKDLYGTQVRLAMDLRRHATQLMDTLSAPARAEIETHVVPRLDAQLGGLRVRRCLWAVRAMVLEVDDEMSGGRRSR